MSAKYQLNLNERPFGIAFCVVCANLLRITLGVSYDQFIDFSNIFSLMNDKIVEIL